MRIDFDKEGFDFVEFKKDKENYYLIISSRDGVARKSIVSSVSLKESEIIELFSEEKNKLIELLSK